MIPEGFPAGFSFKARAALLLAALMTLSLTIFGQTSSGEVNGAVTDQSGAAISAATVKLINQATGIETQASLNKDGRSRSSTSSREYTSCAWRRRVQDGADAGIQRSRQPDSDARPGADRRRRQPDGGSERRRELVQRSSVELGTVISEREVQDLPLNGRNFTQLLTLTPGVTPVSTSQNRNIGGVEGNVGIPGSGFSDPSIHGQQNRSKLYFYDGIINTNIRGPSYIVIPNIDAVQGSSWSGMTPRPSSAAPTGA